VSQKLKIVLAFKNISSGAGHMMQLSIHQC